MRNRFFKVAVAAALTVLLLTGCASGEVETLYSRDIETVYNEIHGQGARDAVALLREGLRSNATNSFRDPYIPVRVPEVVVPVWIPARVDRRTGRYEEGHWTHTVLKTSRWAL